MATRNKTAGSNFERDIVLRLKAIGFKDVATSRLVSRLRDNQKIDIANQDEDVNGRLPYNIQAKNTTTLSYAAVLAELPEVKNVINVVFHKHTKKAGTRFMPQGEYAFLKLEDFLAMMRDLKNSKPLDV